MLKGFPFTDLSGSKLRPAVILIQTDRDLVSFITTQLQRREPTDIPLQPSPIKWHQKAVSN
jgi:mRNA interferase MazF